MITGLPYFCSKQAAYRYYTPYEPDMTNAELRRYVNGKIEQGEIHVGKPDPGKYPGAILRVNKDGRWEAVSI